eukprot:snap_masked-scaffold_4-processed-gene-4.16-mRNA-1 protein AED:1.00 eAED:1.00 QI:0/0/0/0/1/1/2/0/71
MLFRTSLVSLVKVQENHHFISKVKIPRQSDTNLKLIHKIFIKKIDLLLNKLKLSYSQKTRVLQITPFNITG